MWIAIPSSQGTCTLYSSPVSRRFGNKQMTTSVLQDHSTACDGRGPRQAQSDIQVRWTDGPVVRRETEKYWGNGVVLTRLLGIHTDGHAPSLEAAKAEFQASWRQWPAWAKLGEVQ